jgi:hypothetical protein
VRRGRSFGCASRDGAARGFAQDDGGLGEGQKVRLGKGQNAGILRCAQNDKREGAVRELTRISHRR